MLETLNNILILRLSFMQGCGNVVFFEARKKQDLYLWLAKTPEGPSVKFLALNGAQTSVHAFVPLTSLPLHVKKRAERNLLCSPYNGRAEVEWQPPEGVTTTAQLPCGTAPSLRP